MFLLLASMSLREGNNERAIRLLGRAREAIPVQKNSHLVVISLVSHSFQVPRQKIDHTRKISGWNFDRLDIAIQQHVQECIRPLEDYGDAATQSKDLNNAIQQYSAALLLNPPDPAGLLVKRSKAWGMLGKWKDSLKDAEEVFLFFAFLVG